MRNTLGILLMLVALGLLVPGVTEPVLELTGTVDKEAVVELGVESMTKDESVPALMVTITEQLVQQLDIRGELQAYEKTRSIYGTVEELYRAEQWLVAFLIALFSIIIPALKSILMIFSPMMKSRFASMSDATIGFISKWSMADVFVVAIIVAFLAANATQHTEKLFSLTAEFGDGFYYFLGYCLLSILSMQVMEKSKS